MQCGKCILYRYTTKRVCDENLKFATSYSILCVSVQYLISQFTDDRRRFASSKHAFMCLCCMRVRLQWQNDQFWLVYTFLGCCIVPLIWLKLNDQYVFPIVVRYKSQRFVIFQKKKRHSTHYNLAYGSVLVCSCSNCFHFIRALKNHFRIGIFSLLAIIHSAQKVN